MDESNKKLTARIPIIPDDLQNKAQHKDKEIITDSVKDDIYIKREDQYVNITGRIRDTVEEIQDGSCVIHVVTEETLPAIKDRKENHWYFVVTEAKAYATGEDSDTTAYIYYGVINDEYYKDKTYLLIAQNMILNPDVLKMTCPAGYKICFYVPVEYAPRFTDEDTGGEISFTVQDRLYSITPSGTTVSYDVYISDLDNLGDIYVRVDFSGTKWYTVTFESNQSAIDDLTFATEILRVADGTVVGSVNDPTWSNPRYIFKGWSSTKTTYNPINLSTFVITKDTVIYAYFEYDSDPNKYTYKCIFNSSTGLIIGSFYSVAAPNTMIGGKAIIGYTTPTNKEKLTSEGQIFNFTYTPVAYNIIYNLDGGTLTGQKTTYTVEEEYTPPTPTKAGGFSFSRWNPSLIKKGTTGDFTFRAIWVQNGICITGPELRKQILGLYPNIETIATTIERSYTRPSDSDNAINVSSNETEIYIWYNPTQKTIIYYTKNEFSCNANMSGIFEGFTVLTDIAVLQTWEIKPATNIARIFKNCSHLANVSPLEIWKITGDFTEAFLGTAAMNTGRVPNWYIWDCVVAYISTQSKKVLLETKLKKVPNQEFYPDATLNHYSYPMTALVVTSNNQRLEVQCTPESWNIYYVLNGGTLTGQKTTYTVEDVEASAYIPPTPTKTDATFAGWNPANIPVKNTGNVTFTASWT